MGVDLGGTKIEILILTADGKELLRKRVATPKNDYAATIQKIAELINDAESEIKQSCNVGICTPGSLSPSTGLLRNANSVCLNQQTFKQDLEKATQREIRISNDANCFALSEAVDGAGKSAEIVFGVIIGTGVGAGIVIDKKLLRGTNAIAGEWGHNPLPWPENNELDQTKCWCGQQNCIETYLSGPGLERDYFSVTANKYTAVQIAALAQKGDKSADEVLQKYEQRMAKSLAHIINVLDPDAIVLGGGISNLQRLYNNVPLLWDRWIFSDTVQTKLLAPKFGDSSGVRGAAQLWLE